MAEVLETNTVDTPEPEGNLEPNSLLTNGDDGGSEPNNSSLLTDRAVDSKPEPAIETVVPEAYDIKPGDGYEVLPEVMEVVTPLLKKYSLSQEGAQELANAHMDIMNKQAAAAAKFRNDMVQGWVNEIKNDPEFGGAKFNENMAMARRGFRAISPQEEGKAALKELLEESGMGNHPEIIKAFARVGRMVKEDSVLDTGTVASAKNGKTIADAFALSLSALTPKED